MKKKGQVTLFIILAIIIVAGILFAFLFYGKVDTVLPQKQSPQANVESCLRDTVQPSIDAVIVNGGVIEPTFYKNYSDEKYNYLCYQQNWYAPCVNFYPRLREIVEEEIMNNTRGKIEYCFEVYQQEMEAQGYSVTMGATDYNIELTPSRVLIQVTKKIDTSYGETSQSFENFDTYIISPVDDLVDVAREVVAQEAKYCNFEYNGFTLLYPKFEINRFEYDYSRLYQITDRKTGSTFKFAVRSCAFKPGI